MIHRDDLIMLFSLFEKPFIVLSLNEIKINKTRARHRICIFRSRQDDRLQSLWSFSFLLMLVCVLLIARHAFQPIESFDCVYECVTIDRSTPVRQEIEWFFFSFEACFDCE